MNDESIEELIEKAKKGFTPAQIELGHSYLTGVDYDGNEFPQDYGEAKRWLEVAHEKGAYTATVILGTMYEEGEGVPVDTYKAIELYKIAVDRGAYLPCLYLARIYSKGKGIEKSVEEATKWYEKVLSFEGDIDDDGEMDEARDFLKNVYD